MLKKKKNLTCDFCECFECTNDPNNPVQKDLPLEARCACHRNSKVDLSSFSEICKLYATTASRSWSEAASGRAHATTACCGGKLCCRTSRWQWWSHAEDTGSGKASTGNSTAARARRAPKVGTKLP